MIYNKLERKLFVRRKSSFYLKKNPIYYTNMKDVYGLLYFQIFTDNVYAKSFWFLCWNMITQYSNIKWLAREHEYFKDNWH